jgi:2'-phosphotransferase
MRKSSQILIFVDVQNGVVLTEGEQGFLSPTYFQRVEFAKDRSPVPGWEGIGPVVPREMPAQPSQSAEDVEVAEVSSSS